MNIKHLVLLTLSGALLLAGCATAQKTPLQERLITTSKVYNVSFDTLWNAVINTVTGTELDIKILDKSSGLITTESASLGSFYNLNMIDYKKYVQPPFVPLATWTQAKYKLNFKLDKIAENETKLTAKFGIELYDSNATNAWHRTESKGVFEQELFRIIDEKLSVK